MKSKSANYTNRNCKFTSLMANLLTISRATILSILGSFLFLGLAQADHLSSSENKKIVGKIHERTKTFMGNDVGVILAPQETISLPIHPNASKYGEYRKQIERLIEKTWTLSVIILSDDGILIDAYDSEYVTDETRLLGHSMTKSITSMAVGRALCDGYIKSLNDKAGQYDPRIANTLHGETSIKNLLRMASGDKNLTKATSDDAMERAISYSGSLISKYWHLHGTPMTVVNWVKKMKPQSVSNSYHYSDLNTDVLALVVQSATGMALSNYIEATMWAEAKTQHEGHLLLDTNGDPMGHGFLYASRMDWARLALYASKMLQSDNCFGDYLRKATSKQISIPKGKAYHGQYGYQIWVADSNLSKSSVQFAGKYGQRIFIDKATGLIAVIHGAAHRHKQEEVLQKIFSKMNKDFPKTKNTSSGCSKTNYKGECIES